MDEGGCDAVRIGLSSAGPMMFLDGPASLAYRLIDQRRRRYRGLKGANRNSHDFCQLLPPARRLGCALIPTSRAAGPAKTP